MATKAERFRYELERSGPKKAKKVVRVPRAVEGAARNESQHAGKHAAYVLEDAPGARPSRLSTRKSSNRTKTDAQFRNKRRTQESRPAERPRVGPY
jgi:hypothetical protein